MEAVLGRAQSPTTWVKLNNLQQHLQGCSPLPREASAVTNPEVVREGRAFVVWMTFKNKLLIELAIRAENCTDANCIYSLRNFHKVNACL